MKASSFSFRLAAAGCVLASSVAWSVGPGDPAPMFTALTENLVPVDMADFIDGTPLVFIYGSAT